MNAEKSVKFIGYVLIFLLIATMGYWYVNRPNADSIKIVVNEFADEEKVVVTINGKVKKPGTYSVTKGTTVYDCIYMAGGITEDGDPESVDPSKIVYEPCTIEVGKLFDYDTVAYVVPEVPSSQSPCNINTASKETLMNLPGIGEAIASDIINYRETVGNFKKPEDIQNVDGIGTKKYEKIKDLIMVEEQNK